MGWDNARVNPPQYKIRIAYFHPSVCYAQFVLIGSVVALSHSFLMLCKIKLSSIIKQCIYINIANKYNSTVSVIYFGFVTFLEALYLNAAI